jgi:hypothetical protein
MILSMERKQDILMIQMGYTVDEAIAGSLVFGRVGVVEEPGLECPWFIIGEVDTGGLRWDCVSLDVLMDLEIIDVLGFQRADLD